MYICKLLLFKGVISGFMIVPQATRIDTAHSNVSRFYLGEMRQNMRHRLIGMIKTTSN